MRELECNKALLTMALISGADVSITHTLHMEQDASQAIVQSARGHRCVKSSKLLCYNVKTLNGDSSS